jgi:hypothetical protein
VERETLNEREILQVTGLPPAPALEGGGASMTERPKRGTEAA